MVRPTGETFIYIPEKIKLKKTIRKLLNQGLLNYHPFPSPPQRLWEAQEGAVLQTSDGPPPTTPTPPPDSAPGARVPPCSGPERSFRKRRKYGHSPGIWLSIFKKLSNSAIFFLLTFNILGC